MLLGGRGELLHDGAARGVGDVGLHLAAQGALAETGQALAQVLQRRGFAGELGAEAVQVAKHALINQADQAIQLQKGVLQRRGREQHFGGDVRQRLFQRFGNDIAGFIDVAQAVGFVQHDQIPGDGLDVFGLGFGKLVRADDGARVAQKRLGQPLFAQGVVAFGFENQPLQAEFVLQLLMPLLAQIGRDDDEHLAPPLRPALGDDQPGLDGFAQTHFIGQDDAA